MSLSSVGPKFITFTGTETQERTRRDKIEDAAAVTGGVGAGAAATRGNAFKMFKTSEKLRTVVTGASEVTGAVAQPVKQSKSVWNAFKLNYTKFTSEIAEWAKNSKMPNFMKVLFTGKLASAIGKGAAVFVFISGIGEIIDTCVKNAQNVSTKVSTITTNPYKN